MIRVFKLFASTTRTLFIVLIILGGLLIAAARLMAPLAADYREQAAEWAGEILGHPLVIGRMETGWQGFGPELILKDIALLGKPGGKPLIRLSRVQITVSLLDSLIHRRIQPRRIALYEPRLHITRAGDGSISIVGLDSIEESRPEQTDASGALLLPARLTIHQGEITWEDQTVGGAPLHFVEVELKVHNDGSRHQLSGQLVSDNGGRGTLKVAIDLVGDLNRAADWSADIYLKGSALNLAVILNRRLPENFRLENGFADMELWGQWDRGRLNHLEGSTHWREFFLSRIGDTLAIDKFGGNFLWRRLRNGWRLEIGGMQLDRTGFVWPQTRMGLKVQYDEEERLRLSAGLGFVRLEDISALADILPLLSGSVKEALKTVHPKGNLRDLRFRYQESAEGPRWSASGRAEPIFTRPWKKLPGIEHLPFRFRMDQDHGTLEVDATSVTARFPELFRDPLNFERLRGRLDWKRLEAGGWQITAPDVLAENRDISSRTRLYMAFPDGTEQPAFMDLQTDFHDGDGTTTSRYLPVGIMPDTVVEWLDRSIIGGRVTAGSCIVRGPLDRFPYGDGSGRFEVFFSTEGIELDYWPGWPGVTALNTEVRFLNTRFDAWVSDGRIYDSRIVSAHARIPDLAEDVMFELTGQVSGPLENAHRLLRESPLQEEFNQLTSTLDGEGPSRLDLEFAIPITSEEAFRLNGNLALLDATVRLHKHDLALTHVTGGIGFDQAGIRGEKISATLDGSPITLDLQPIPGETDSTRIIASGKTTGEALRKRFPGITPLQILEGKADWQLRLDLSHEEGITGEHLPLVVTSDLRGMAVKLPAPLGKPPAQPMPLTLSMDVGRRNGLPVELQYGKVLHAALLLDTATDEPGLIGGDIRVGGGTASPPREKGLQLRVELPQLTLDPWLKQQAMPVETAPAPLLRQLELEIGTLSLAGETLENLRLAMQRDGDGLSGHAASDRFSGALRIPPGTSAEPIRLDLEWLDIPYVPAEDEQAGKDSGGAEEEIDPTTLPAVAGAVAELRINGEPFGPLRFNITRLPDGVELQQLLLDSERLHLDLSGRWIVARSGLQESTVYLAAQSDDLGKLLENFGFTRNIDDAPMEMEARLSWRGGPTQFAAERTGGEMNLGIGKGRFLNVDPGVGRIFGLLNISALQRRLTLDFSDIFKKGFSFDRIEGDFLLDEGNAYTNNFNLSGPSTRIEIAGRIGFADMTFDQQVTVIPRITSTLPLAGIIAGGPAVGAALFLAEKLVGKKFDRISRIEYLVTGPWSDPVFTKRSREEQEATLDRSLLSPSDQRWQLPSAHGDRSYSLTGEEEGELKELNIPGSVQRNEADQ